MLLSFIYIDVHAGILLTKFQKKSHNPGFEIEKMIFVEHDRSDA